MGMPEKGFGGRERWLKRRERNQKQPSPTAVTSQPFFCLASCHGSMCSCSMKEVHVLQARHDVPTDWPLQQSVQTWPCKFTCLAEAPGIVSYSGQLHLAARASQNQAAQGLPTQSE